MIEINVGMQIKSEILETIDIESVEKMITAEISKGLADEITKKLDDIPSFEMEMDQNTGVFNVKAELVLCSKQDIITNAEMQAQKLAKYGLNQDQILDVLETITNSSGGF